MFSSTSVRRFVLRPISIAAVAALTSATLTVTSVEAASPARPGVGIKRVDVKPVQLRRKDVQRPVRRPHGVMTPRAADGSQAWLVAAPPNGPVKSTWQVTYNGFDAASNANGPAAQAAFQAAVDVWARIITSNIPIKVTANFAALPQYVLGSAGASTAYSHPSIGDGVSYYPSALADVLYGQDIAPLVGGAPPDDIQAQFTSDPSVSFYFGTDGAPGAGQIDFMSVVMHELGHGLGFAGSATVANGVGSYSGTPYRFDRFPYDASTGGNLVISTANNSAALASVLQSQSIYWDGAGGKAANGGARPRMYAPAAWQQGSSYSHLDEATFGIGNPNSLMTPQISAGEAVHSPGQISVAIMADEGWTASLPTLSAPQPPTNVTAIAGNASAAVSWTAPSSNGGSAITGYTATSSPGGLTCTTSTTGCTVNGLTNGTPYTFTVTATNSVGTSTPSTASSPVTPAGADTTPPDTTLTATEPNPTNDPTGDFTFTSTEAGSSFQCSVDGAAYSSCTSPFSTAALGEGSHTFGVRATDPAGNTDPTPATHAWLVDLTAPDTTLTATEPNPTNDTTADFSFTSTEASSTFQCSVDNAAYSSCTSPFSTAVLSVGSHTFAVKATDPAGNTDLTPATHTWVLDLTAPDTTLTATEPNPTNDTTGDFSFTSTEASSTFQCSVDNAAYTSCTSPFSTAVLSAGSHTFAVKATDPAGNTDPTPATHTWVLDLTAPDTTLTATEPNPTNDTTGDFSFTSTKPGSTFECAVDEDPWEVCASPYSTKVLGAGGHAFAVRATDPAGNVDPTSATHSWTVDLTAPDTSFTATEPDPTNDTTGDFTFTSTEAGSTFQCSVDNAAFSTCTSPFSTAVLTAGSHTLAVRATDQAGNTDATPASHTWVLDLTAPDTSFTATEPNPTNDTTGDFTFTSTEAGSTFQCSVDNAAFSTCTSPFSTAVLTAGSHTLAVKATDQAGNTDATPASHTWVLDLTAPDTSFTATEPNPTNDTTGDFTFTSTEAGSTFQCSVDNAAFSTCTSPFSTTALGEGSHTLAVRATDQAANTDASPASYTWVVDLTAPDTSFTATEPNPTNDPTADFAFTSTEAGSTFQCSLDSAAYTSCTSPFSTTALAPGSHTFAVRATDQAANTDATPASHTWFLDTTTPDTSFTATEPNPTNDATADFAFTSTKAGSTFECSVDSAAFSSCTSPFSTSALGEGPHTLAVRATDSVGNTDPSPVGYGWTVDLTAPNTSFTATEPDPTNDTTGDFTFTSTEAGSTFECSVDSAAFTSCTTPFGTAVLAAGSHTLAVRATDQAGNTDATPATHTWVLDVTAPDTSFTAAEPNPTNDTTGDFTFTSTEGGSTFECSVDNAVFASCTSPFATAVLTAGSHTLAVKATDQAGNTDATPASHTWVLDLTAPDTSFTATEANPTNDTTGDFAFASTEAGATFECSLDSAVFSSCTSPLSTAVLAAGSHTFAVRATDQAGNTDSTPASYTWLLDVTAPDTSFTATEPDPTNDVTADFTFTSTEAGSTYECSVDSVAFTSCTSPFSTAALTAGSHTLEVRATDQAGNTDATPASHTWVLDLSTPDTSFTATEPDPTSDATGDFAFTSTEPTATFECSVDSAAFTSCTSPFSTTALASGSHTLAVRAKDSAGNTDASPASHTWAVDLTAPDTSFTATEPDPTNDTTGDFTFTSTEAGSTFECSVDSAAFSSCTSPFSTAVLPTGPHTLAVRATDGVGNTDQTPTTHTWTVDLAAPDTSFTATEPDPTNDTTGDFTFSSTELGSTFECSLDSAAFTTCTSPFSTAVLSAGSHTLAVRATDQAGNTDATPASSTWVLDLTAPDTSFTATEPNPTNDTTGDFTFTSTETGSTFECSVDSAPFTTCSSPFATAALTAGPHTLGVRATDQAGNPDATPVSYTWTLDLTGPNTTLTATEPNPTNDTTGDFAFTSTEVGSTFECSVDSAAFSTCSTPFATTALTAGSHTFAVRATDAAGNTDASPASHTWVLDVTAPDTSFTATEPDPTNDTTGDFAFTSTEAGSTFECSVDSAAFTSCTTPFSTSVLAAGPHTLAVRATDAAGNTDTTPAQHSWVVDLTVVDTTAPNTSFTATEPDPTSDPTGDFAFTSTEAGSTFGCSVDGAAFSVCTSPFSTPALGAGVHTFAVRATDAAGNTDTTPASYSWTVTLTAPPGPTTTPDTLLLSSEPDPTNDPTGDFTFSSTTAGAIFACSVDSAAFTTCTSPFSTAPLAEGRHTFAVRAIDGAGEVDPSPATSSWSIDASGPATWFTAQPATFSRSTSAAFGFAGSDPNRPDAVLTFQCSLDLAPLASCSGPVAVTGLAQGSHTFRVIAVDELGNQGSAVVASWQVDTIAPSLAVRATPLFSTAAAVGTGFAGSDPSGSGVANYDVRYRVAAYNRGFAPTVSPPTWQRSTATTRTLRAVPGSTQCFSSRARDLAGNVSPWSRESCVASPLDDRVLTRSAGWTSTADPVFYLRTATSTVTRSQSLTLTGVQTRRLALVASTCATCGAVDVYFNGVLMRSVSLRSTRVVHRQVLPIVDLGAVRTGTVVIRTRSNATVRVDGLGVTKA